MQIVDAAKIEPRTVSGHRTGDIVFQRLLQGTPNTRDNFEFSLVRNRGSYYTPRHRHNFDQIRMVMEGKFAYAGRKAMRAGSVGYFPEGTYYGPQNVADCLTLVLQSGALSGDGFMSYDQLHNGHIEMLKLGSFANGIFTRSPDNNRAPGTRKNQDSYEAIWSHVNGRTIKYPKARYSEPVIMLPEAWDWQKTANAGIEEKALGTFVGNTRIALVKLAAGSQLPVEASQAIHLLFVLSGAGSCGSQAWGRWSAIKIERGEKIVLAASEDSEIFLIAMPELNRARARIASVA
jgi:hypothetical protein